MSLLVQLPLLFITMSVLVFFADKLVDAASKIAKGLGIGDAVIGLTLLAYGTSIPEFAVSTISSYKAHAGLSVANVIGSNIVNIAIVIGVVSLINPIIIRSDALWKRDGVFMLFATFVFVILAYFGGVSRIAGLLMLCAVVYYTVYLIRGEQKKKRKKQKVGIDKQFLIATGCIVGVFISGHYTVNLAINVAHLLGISEWIIGATIVSLGTSLPEIVVSIMAASKRKLSMSLGNIVGSNYFNLFLVIGAASVVRPIAIVFSEIAIDLLFLCIFTILFFIGLKKKRFGMLFGIIFLWIYLGYIAYLVL
ncbi:calcium/sodium antiporter [Candidatus Undinarchaeota archaeon]